MFYALPLADDTQTTIEIHVHMHDIQGFAHVYAFQL